MAPPTLLATGLCRHGHVIASEIDLVGSGRNPDGCTLPLTWARRENFSYSSNDRP